MTIPPSLAQPSFSQAPIETTDPNAISKTIVDAKGDLIAGTADNAVSRQAAGSNGTFLTADSAQSTGLAWVANPVDTAFDAKGDILVGTGPDTYVKLPVGTTNQVLIADSTQASGVRWSSEQDPNAIVKSIVDAKGDLIAATAADTPARLPVGTDNQLLIADSTQTTGLKWGRPDITLGTETTGNYVAGITGGTGVTVTGSGSEGATPSVAIGQSVGTGDTVAFGGLNVDSGTLYVDSTNNRVGINNTTPSYSLDVTGDGHLSGALTVDGILYANHIHGALAGSLYYHIKNNSGSTINAGTPVYITGTVGASGTAEVSPSRADTSSTMPAVGITSATLAQGDSGHMIVIGALDGLNTNSYSLSQPLYIGATGGLTNTRPTGASDVIQVIAYASRINASTGEIIVNAYDQVRSPNSISIVGNIATTSGQFSGSGAGLTSIPASQLSGTVPSTNIGNDSVALGTKTTGDYVATLQAGTGVTVTNGAGEGVSPTIAIGQAVGTSDSPTFTGLTTLSSASLYDVAVTTGVTANSVSASTVSGTTLTVNGKQIDTTGATSNQVLKFNGTKFAPNTVAASELSGTTLASGVTSSSLTSLGVLTGLSMATGTANLANIDAVGTIVAHASSVQDGVKLQGRAGGSSSVNVTLTPTTLTGNRTLTLPDASGTVATTDLVPAGCIMQYAGSSAPSGWLLCDGTAVSRSTYATLFGITSTTYGAGNGSTTFNLPDLRTRVPVGKNATGTFATLGGTGGAETVTLTSAEMPSHTHTQNSHTHTDSGHTHNLPYVYGSAGGTIGFLISGVTTIGQAINSSTANISTVTATNQNTGGGGAHSNLQPYIVLNYIIKT